MTDALAAEQRRYRHRRPIQVMALVSGLAATGVFAMFFIDWATPDFPQDHGLRTAIEWSNDPQYFDCVAETIERDPAPLGATNGFELLPGAEPWRNRGAFLIRTSTRLLDARYGEHAFTVTNTVLDPWHFSLTC